MKARHVAAVALWAGVSVLPVLAQNVISARSGLIHYVEGRVYLNDQAVESKYSQFSEVKEKQVLRTQQGRAEILLGPGVFLRMPEDSSFRMISNRLIDTRVEHLTGSILIECVDLPKDNTVTIADKNTTVTLHKKGLYRFDSNPAQVRVYEGEALVESNGQKIELKKGKLVALDSLVAGKFDPKETDELFRWSERRASLIAMANVSAAKSFANSGYSASGGFGCGSGYSASRGWGWNPYFGLFTFIPCSGSYYSPFGYRYWSPVTVHRVYYHPPPASTWSTMPTSTYNASRGYDTVSSTPSGTSGTVVSAGAPTSSSHGSSAPISRGSGSAGGSHR